MELSNEFDVPVPVNQAWELLTDLERIAPCLPGAQLQEIEGDEYRGIVKIKVGPITAQYKGAAHFVEKDAEAHKAILTASGRDTRGQGNASAAITAELTEKEDGVTHVSVLTDLTITGKVAQFGRGVIGDVSEKLLGQFVKNLETMILSDDKDSSQDDGATPDEAQALVADTTGGGGGSGDGGDAGDDDTTQLLASELAQVWDEGNGAAAPVRAERPTLAPRPDLLVENQPDASSTWNEATETAQAAAEAPKVRKIDAPEAEAIDLLDAAGGTMAKRLVPLVGAVFALLVVIGVLRRRRAR